MYKCFLPLLLLFLLSACTAKVAETAARSGELKTVVYGQEEALAPGQSLSLGKAEAAFTFLRLVSDSRCPKGVSCVQAGEAIVQLQRGTEPPEEVVVMTDPKHIVKLPIEGGVVSLIDIDPYPEATVATSPEAYRLRVIVSKAPR